LIKKPYKRMSCKTVNLLLIPADPVNLLYDRSKDLRVESPLKHDKMLLSSLNRLSLRSSFLSFDDRTSKPVRESPKQDN